MKPNAVMGATARLAASASLGFALATAAIAGDRALIDYLGYSEDGRYFAFEEFGIQDGSGFAYANIYVVDLTTDSWVGTPVRVRLEDETARVVDARAQAREQAGAMLEEVGIEEAAHELAVNGDGEAGADGYSLRFGRPGYGLDEPRDVQELAIESYPADSPQDCEAYLGEKALGFALTLDGADVHRDEGPLPNSRGCPTDYRLHAVVAPAEWTGAAGGLVAIISSYPFGFEGPDRRFLAVPLPQ